MRKEGKRMNNCVWVLQVSITHKITLDTTLHEEM